MAWAPMHPPAADALGVDAPAGRPNGSQTAVYKAGNVRLVTHVGDGAPMHPPAAEMGHKPRSARRKTCGP